MGGMLVEISTGSIIITERIRKEVRNINDLTEDISRNGLINPITIMKTEYDDTYRLIAGLRRLRAAQALKCGDVESSVVSPADAEAALLIEISKNEQRQDFTFYVL